MLFRATVLRGYTVCQWDKSLVTSVTAFRAEAIKEYAAFNSCCTETSVTVRSSFTLRADGTSCLA